MYSLKVLPRAQKDLDRIRGPAFSLIAKAIKSLADNPRPPGCKKLVAMDGYRIRLRDYRILYRIDDKAKTVFVYRVRQRGQAYR